jgi:hypothetical protein
VGSSGRRAINLLWGLEFQDHDRLVGNSNVLLSKWWIIGIIEVLFEVGLSKA